MNGCSVSVITLWLNSFAGRVANLSAAVRRLRVWERAASCSALIVGVGVVVSEGVGVGVDTVGSVVLGVGVTVGLGVGSGGGVQPARSAAISAADPMLSIHVVRIVYCSSPSKTFAVRAVALPVTVIGPSTVRNIGS